MHYSYSVKKVVST